MTAEEMSDVLYKPREGEWGVRRRDEESERIIGGIEQLITVGESPPPRVTWAHYPEILCLREGGFKYNYLMLKQKLVCKDFSSN